MFCNPTVCFKIWVIQFKFCCNSMISHPLLKFRTQFSQNEEVGSYDSIALNQRYSSTTDVSAHRLKYIVCRKIGALVCKSLLASSARRSRGHIPRLIPIYNLPGDYSVWAGRLLFVFFETVTVGKGESNL